MKKNREMINIFSASVIDLFASALGVFILMTMVLIANVDSKNKSIAPQLTANPKKDQSFRPIDLPEIVTDFEYSIDKPNTLNHVNFLGDSDSLIDPYASWEIKRIASFIKKNSFKKVNVIGHTNISKTEFEAFEIFSTIKNPAKEVYEKMELIDKKIDEINKEILKFQPNTIKLEFKQREFPVTSPEYRKIRMQIKEAETPIKNLFDERSNLYAEKRKLAENIPHQFIRQAILIGLSSKRAQKVCQKLIEFGVNDEVLNCYGVGSSQLILLEDFHNDIEANDQGHKNRRVEISFSS